MFGNSTPCALTCSAFGADYPHTHAHPYTWPTYCKRTVTLRALHCRISTHPPPPRPQKSHEHLRTLCTVVCPHGAAPTFAPAGDQLFASRRTPKSRSKFAREFDQRKYVCTKPPRVVQPRTFTAIIYVRACVCVCGWAGDDAADDAIQVPIRLHQPKKYRNLKVVLLPVGKSNQLIRKILRKYMLRNMCVCVCAKGIFTASG